MITQKPVDPHTQKHTVHPANHARTYTYVFVSIFFFLLSIKIIPDTFSLWQLIYYVFPYNPDVESHPWIPYLYGSLMLIAISIFSIMLFAVLIDGLKMTLWGSKIRSLQVLSSRTSRILAPAYFIMVYLFRFSNSLLHAVDRIMVAVIIFLLLFLGLEYFDLWRCGSALNNVACPTQPQEALLFLAIYTLLCIRGDQWYLMKKRKNNIPTTN